MKATIIKLETIPITKKASLHPILSTKKAIKGVARAGPTPQEAIINPIAIPR